MTKDEALAFDLALEALEGYCEHGVILRPLEVRDALKQARSAPVQEPAEVLGHNGWGFPIKTVAPVQEDWGPGPHECHSLTAPVQEPKFWYDQEEGLLHDHFDDSPFGCIPLYTTPPAARRQWVRLTNEEISQIYLVNTDKPLKADWLFARAIEAKLKEKNT